jgi:hypothetical protein
MKEGKSREQMAKELKYKDWRGFDVFMRRQGYSFKNGQYVLPGDIPEEVYTPPLLQTVRLVIEQINHGNTSLDSIAGKVGFKSRKDLADYMKMQGYDWDPKKGNYVCRADVTEGIDDGDYGDVDADETDDLDSDVPYPNGLSNGHNGNVHSDMMILQAYLPLLQFLQLHERELEILVSKVEQKGTIPRYSVPSSITVTKSVSMASLLDQLIRDFSTETGISQRVIFETALLEFMKKYGYSRQVEALLAGQRN